MAVRVANVFQREGFGTLPVPAPKRTNDEHISGIFSRKLTAHMAGLGWIKKSCPVNLSPLPVSEKLLIANE